MSTVQKLPILPICSFEEMQKMEKSAFQKGRDEKKIMENAGRQIALACGALLFQNHLSENVYLLVGKGNNGADGYVVGRYLIESGFSVLAYQIGNPEEASSLNKEMRALFVKKGGKVENIHSENDLKFEENSLLVDGLLGTGFSGELSSMLKKIIEKVNGSSLRIVSIDVPSGLAPKNKKSPSDTHDKKQKDQLIKAEVTCTLGLPKTELFYSAGYANAGEIRCLDIGYTKEDIQSVKADFGYLEEKAVSSLLPPIDRLRNKYSAGFVVGVAGSPGMEGAANLASLAALRTGAGIVKLFTTPEMDMGNAPYEIVKVSRQKDSSQIIELANKASCIYIGPGLGREEKEEELLFDLISQIHVPCVIDGDGLYFLSMHPDIALPKESLLTPHRKEMQRLLGLEYMPDEEELFSLTQAYVNKKKVFLILKGAPTFVFVPNSLAIVIPRGDPGLATAGTGDVLTGILAALIAQGLSCYEAALLGVYLLDISSEIAAKEKTSYSLIASDVIAFLPQAIKELQRLKKSPFNL